MSEIALNSIFNGITRDMLQMEEKQEVDLQIIQKIEDLEDIFKKYKENVLLEKWLTNKEGYNIYSTAKNAQLVLNKMKERFRTSKEKNDNPKVVIDALPIIDIIKRIAISIDRSLNRMGTTDTELKVELREAAKQRNMILPLLEELQKADKKELKSALIILQSNLEPIRS